MDEVIWMWGFCVSAWTTQEMYNLLLLSSAKNENQQLCSVLAYKEEDSISVEK